MDKWRWSVFAGETEYQRLWDEYRLKYQVCLVKSNTELSNSILFRVLCHQVNVVMPMATLTLVESEYFLSSSMNN